MSSTKTPKKLAVRRLQSSRPFTALLEFSLFLQVWRRFGWRGWCLGRAGRPEVGGWLDCSLWFGQLSLT